MGKYETKNSCSVVRAFGAASVEMFQPEVNASSYQIRRRYFRLQKFIRLCIEMRYLVIFISMECIKQFANGCSKVNRRISDAYPRVFVVNNG